MAVQVRTGDSYRVWRKLAPVAVRLLGPLLLVAVILRLGNRPLLSSVLRQTDLFIVVGAMLLNAVNIHLKVLRWRVLLRVQGYAYGTRAAWRAILPSMFLGMLTPGRVGDLVRIQYVRRDIGMPYPEGLALVIVDRLCDLYVLLAFVAAGIVHFAGLFTAGPRRLELHGLVALLLVVAAAAPLLLFATAPLKAVLRRIYRRLFSAHAPESPELFLAALRSHVSVRLLYTVPLSVGAFLVQYVQGWLVSRALGLDVPFVDIMFMLALTSLLGLLPLSISGLGLRELFLAMVFPSLGLTSEQGVAFGLVVFAVVYLATIAAGFLAWQWSPPRFGRSERPA